MPKKQVVELTEDDLQESLEDFRSDNDRNPTAKELAIHATGEDEPTEEQLEAAQEYLDELAIREEPLEKEQDDMFLVSFTSLLRIFGAITDWSRDTAAFHEIQEALSAKARERGYRDWHHAYTTMANNEWELP